jgi:hypothetical protein
MEAIILLLMSVDLHRPRGAAALAEGEDGMVATTIHQSDRE